MKNIKLTAKELKALKELIWNSNPCSSGCVYPKMQNSRKDCDECEFIISIESIKDKIGFY